MFRPEFRCCPPVRMAAVTALTFLLTACVVSLEPAIPESESIFEPALLGTWVQEGGETAAISDAGDGGYLIDYVDAQGKHGQFSGRLGWLEDRLVLEVTPVLPDTDANDEYTALILPARVQIGVTLREGTLEASVLDSDSLRTRLRSDMTRTPHLTDASSAEADIVLTGTTAEIRTWLIDYLRLPGALGEPGVWRSVNPGP